ncbi:M23 family metallopeptidase [Candidatus Pandoraea novymonadis]|uniref:Murein DD-endopeptidase MepM n=1 Tax=Candidatus Pandoraea novymonadis TaxID=1808959 RepID=A0ABX5FH15_9BURK|nr:M23 family metallopeptidase [Candidatus Pandoraea novymonadis]PSB92317.1 Murein DD-endopeptidase MepM [Candidatus Pandoraea novymonadis]
MYTNLRDFFVRELLILIDPTQSEHQKRKVQIVATVSFALTLLGIVTLFNVAPMVPNSSHAAASTNLPLRFPSLAKQQIDAQTETFIHQIAVRRGETLNDILARLSVNDNAAQRFIRNNVVARRLVGTTAGRVIQAKTDKNGHLISLSSIPPNGASNAKKLVLERNDTGVFHARIDRLLNNNSDWAMCSVAVDNNFFNAMRDAGVPDTVVTQIVNIFSGVINFEKEVGPGDYFNLIYENTMQQDRTAEAGRLLAIEFVNRGKTHQAIWYTEPDGNSEGSYYGFDGRKLNQVFLRTPVEFSRISSTFGGREHPLARQWKQHQGVDLAAPTGTCVFAAGDGVVNFVGRKNGYGNIVMINHHSDYQTRYAHLSAFSPKVRTGTRVTQGQIIGYIGQTGWATGPHLHYELRHKGKPHNPFSKNIAAVAPLSGHRLKLFDMYTENLLKYINLMRALKVTKKRD